MLLSAIEMSNTTIQLTVADTREKEVTLIPTADPSISHSLPLILNFLC